jgi:putative ABC transport system substrate-binding protein
MRRRDFITLLSAAAPAWPGATWGQQPTMPLIGFLHSGSSDQNAERVAAWRKGLSDAGFIEGQNVAIEYRWAAGENDKLPALAADLIRRQVSLIATPGSTPAAVVAKAATATIPIVFAAGGDPVALGLVASLNRPGGNATGSTSMNAEITAKRFGVIRELVPQATRYFALVNPTSVLAEFVTKDLQAGAATLGTHVEILRAGSDRDIEAALANLPQGPGTVLVLGPDAFFYVRRTKIAALAIQHMAPAIFDDHDYVGAGGLVSYGANFSEVLQLAGNYAGRILKGERPADLPVAQPTKFVLAINLKSARALGVSVPTTLLAIADEIIE